MLRRLQLDILHILQHLECDINMNRYSNALIIFNSRPCIDLYMRSKGSPRIEDIKAATSSLNLNDMEHATRYMPVTLFLETNAQAKRSSAPGYRNCTAPCCAVMVRTRCMKRAVPRGLDVFIGMLLQPLGHGERVSSTAD